jgi:prephenate dehydrogenase
VSTPKPRITIVGLGLIGGSIGLALRQAEVTTLVMGHDKDRTVSDEAKKRGAVDRVHWNLISACEDADLVILAAPVAAIEETLKVIGPNLRPGCVVIDTASLKGPVMGWAETYLPDEVHFIGGDPILSTGANGQGGLEAARADLFHQGLFCLIPSTKAESAAVQLASDLVSILGAKPLFLDAAEHDGLLAGVEHLPALLALATLEATIQQPSWRELRKVAGPGFELGTQLVTESSVQNRDLYLLNRENLMRWIDVLIASLDSIRDGLAGNEPEAWTKRWQNALQERQKWLADRTEGQWYEGPKTEMPRMNLADSFLGTFWRRKPKEQP